MVVGPSPGEAHQVRPRRALRHPRQVVQERRLVQRPRDVESLVEPDRLGDRPEDLVDLVEADRLEHGPVVFGGVRQPLHLGRALRIDLSTNRLIHRDLS